MPQLSLGRRRRVLLSSCTPDVCCRRVGALLLLGLPVRSTMYTAHLPIRICRGVSVFARNGLCMLTLRCCVGQPTTGQAANLPPGWTMHHKDGQPYFYNSTTKESTYTNPSNDSPWQEGRMQDGRQYWHNKVTKVSQWYPPGQEPPQEKKAKPAAKRVAGRCVTSRLFDCLVTW